MSRKNRPQVPQGTGNPPKVLEPRVLTGEDMATLRSYLILCEHLWACRDRMVREETDDCTCGLTRSLSLVGLNECRVCGRPTSAGEICTSSQCRTVDKRRT
jgi:hypothetical protein